VSHDLANIEGRVGFAYAGTDPWHRLGIKVPGLMTTREALIAGNANWLVKKIPLQLAGVSQKVPVEGMGIYVAEPIAVPSHYATCRIGPEKDDAGDEILTPLGVVGERYTVVQNHEAFDFFDAALGDGAAVIETVGVLGKGERVFAIARLPKTFEVTPNDPIEPYILLHTSHNGTSPTEARFTYIRVVCKNTLQAATGRGAKCSGVVHIKHTKNALDRIQEAYRVLHEEEGYWTRLRDSFKAMAMADMTRLDVINFLGAMFPGKTVKDADTGKDIEKVSGKARNAREAVTHLFEGDAQGAELVGKSRWAMFQAVTEYIDSPDGRPIRGATDRWESSTFGTGADLRQKAYNLLKTGGGLDKR
jgi:phage/plasmid-like protein (TIGR03299 family)